MSDVAIKVEGLGKKYFLRHQAGGRSRYVALRDVLAHKFTSLFRRNGHSNPNREEFWALKDVSFEIKHGEAVGIIGRNGAGKSTLLKTIVRLIKPLEGILTVFGKPPGSTPKRIAYLGQFHNSGFIPGLIAAKRDTNVLLFNNGIFDCPMM